MPWAVALFAARKRLELGVLAAQGPIVVLRRRE
jgi:hypothetical protein